MQHPNARLTPRGRLELVKLVVEEGRTFRAAAAARKVSVSTVWEWVSRWRQAGAAERASLACLADRRSRPHRRPRVLPPLEQARILLARRRSGWGPRLIAGETGHPHSTVWKVLRRHGASRVARPAREPACRYEWPCPGDLVHMDVARYARFTRPGHAVTGDRTKSGAEKRAGVGYEYAHAMVDDHSRLAYVELLPDERAQSVSAFTRRALAFFARHGIRVRRVMSDNAWAYTHNRSLATLLAARGIRHLRTRPYRPRTNGKAERFIQTLLRDWAYAVRYETSHHRTLALTPWLDYYNQRRPHGALGHQPPASRLPAA